MAHKIFGGAMAQETSGQNYEWHRERVLREKKNPNNCSTNRVEWNVREIAKNHGEKAAKEMAKEFNSSKTKKKQYFT